MRSRLRGKTAEAFAPSAITNFFEISYNSSPRATGATGGGYILSKGTRTKATVTGGGKGEMSTTVNGDQTYDARTTKRSVELLLAGMNRKLGEIRLDQLVETPIGAGFGASAAGAVSAVYAVASATDINATKSELALFAHRAEIIESTGLGTVSVIYDSAGAGAITVPGEPGVAKFVTVDVPRETRIVTGHLAPFDKKDAFSSKTVSERINILGREALKTFLACLLYTSPSPRDLSTSRMPSSA